MPIELLTSLPPATPVYLDANVFVYGLNGQSAVCGRLLRKCSNEQQLGITLLETINEATHKFMVSEAFAKGLVAKPTAQALRARSHVIPSLREYWRLTERILRMDILFLSVSEALARQAQVERQAYGLLTNDSLIVAAMRHYGIRQIASNDEDFGSISGITLFRADDIQPL